MKKIVPIVILLLGILVAIGVFFLLKSKNGVNKPIDEPTQEETVPEIALEKRPVVSLTPSADGHWLKLEIKKILIEAATLDYELTYQVPDGRTQGVPGTVKLNTKDDITKDLLLGSESSGKFRYDEGVKEGLLVLKFRNSGGKLVAKFSTNFYLEYNTTELTFLNGGKYLLDKQNKNFYVSMDTLGFIDNPSGLPDRVYGIFSSKDTGNSGKIESDGLHLYYKNDWYKIEDSKSPAVGYFITLP